MSIKYCDLINRTLAEEQYNILNINAADPVAKYLFKVYKKDTRTMFPSVSLVSVLLTSRSY